MSDESIGLLTGEDTQELKYESNDDEFLIFRGSTNNIDMGMKEVEFDAEQIVDELESEFTDGEGEEVEFLDENTLAVNMHE